MALRVGNLVWKELVQLYRDWVMTAFILTLPVLQLVLLAQSTSGISDLGVVVLDRDRSSASRRLIEALDNRRELDVRYVSMTLDENRRLLNRGDVVLAATIPANFGARLNSPGPVHSDSHSRAPSVQLIAEGSNDLIASIALGAARDVLADFAVEETGFLRRNRVSIVDLRTTVRFNPTFNVKFFTVPAQVGFIVYQVTLTVASIGLARERELGTLEQLLVMPLRRLELVVGKAIPALIVGTLNFLLMLGVAILAFGVPMRGSLPLLLALTVLFIAAEIGYGLLISGIAHTQQQAILFVFVLAMVDMAFSGYLVPIKNLPTALRIIAEVVPFRHYLTIIRGVMLKGGGVEALWPHAAAIALMGTLITALGARNLSRSLD